MTFARLILLVLPMFVAGCFETAYPPPDLRAVEPARLRSGEMLTLVGKSLGVNPQQKEVQIGGKSAHVVTWTELSVIVAVPELPEGPAEVSLTRDGEKAETKTVIILGAPPIVQELEPRRVWPDEPVHLVGHSFGAKNGQVLLGGTSLEVTAWTPKKVSFKLPEGFKEGQVILRTEAGQESVPIPVPLAQPVIESIDPPGAVPGATIFIDGLHMGSDLAKGKVFFGEVEGRVKGWTPRQIEVEVPQVESSDFKVPLVVAYGTVRSNPRDFRLPSPAPFGPLIEAGTEAGPYSRILVDSKGSPIVMWYCDIITQVLSMRWDGFRWQDLPRMTHPMLYEGLPKPNMVKAFGFGVRAAIDEKDHVHLAAVCTHDSSVLYSKFDGTGWVMEPAIAPLKRRSFQSVAVELDGKKQPIVAVFREESGITAHTKTKDGWNMSVVDGNGSEGGWAAWVDMVRDTAGNLQLTYFDGGKGRLMHAQQAGDGWKLEPIDTAGIAGAYASLTRGSKGELAVSYACLEAQEIRLARFSGGKWAVQTVAKGEMMNGHTAAIIDSKGRVHILFGQKNRETGGHLHYAVEKDNGQFEVTLLSKDVGEAPRPSMALDFKGRIHMLWYDDKRRGLVYDMKPHVPGVENRPRDIQPAPFDAKRFERTKPVEYSGPLALPADPKKKK